MKLYLALALVLVSLSVTYGKRCQTADECDDGQCCVALLTGHLPKKGLCLRLNKNGARCSEPDSKNDYYGGKFLYFCPCAEGLACKPKGLKPGVTDRPTILKKLRCQQEDKTTPPIDNKETSPVENKQTSPADNKETSPVEEKKETSPADNKETSPVEETTIVLTLKPEIVETSSTVAPTDPDPKEDPEPEPKEDPEPEPDEDPEPEPDEDPEPEPDEDPEPEPDEEPEPIPDDE